MASARSSSEDVSRDRGPQLQTLGNLQPRRRSESRKVYERQRPIKAVPGESFQKLLHEGDAVRVFSRHADKWVDGKIVQFLDTSSVCVEYAVGMYMCRKSLHLHDEYLITQAAVTSTLEMQHQDTIPSLPQVPMMQGNRTQLVEPEKLYMTLDLLFEMLESADVVLVKGSWLVECYQNFEVLPRRQNLPARAIWNPLELREYVSKDAVSLISISHCWHTKQHPDPEGDQLQDVGPILESRLKHSDETWPQVCDLAVFWCWCSYYQEPRTEVEQEVFNRSLNYMDVWYTNPHFSVWILSNVPNHVENSRPYEDRGWTTWESTVAKIFCQYPPRHKLEFHRGHMLGWASSAARAVQRMPLDLGIIPLIKQMSKSELKRFKVQWSLSGSKDPRVFVQNLSFDQIHKLCGHTVRHLPIHPDTFGLIIEEKVFTKGKTDCQLVKDNYRRNFWQAVSAIDVLCIDNSPVPWKLRWSNSEIEQFLQDILPRCARLECVSLTACKMNEVGTHAFARSLCGCHHVKVIELFNCNVTDSGVCMIAESLRRCSKIQELTLVDRLEFRVGNDGIKALALVLPECQAFMCLKVTNPKIHIRRLWIRMLMNALRDFTLDTSNELIFKREVAEHGSGQVERIQKIQQQVEYYMSDSNLMQDAFFHRKISAEAEGWLDLIWIVACTRIMNLKPSFNMVLEAVTCSSLLEVQCKDGAFFAIRRASNRPLPALQTKS